MWSRNKFNILIIFCFLLLRPVFLEGKSIQAYFTWTDPGQYKDSYYLKEANKFDLLILSDYYTNFYFYPSMISELKRKNPDLKVLLQKKALGINRTSTAGYEKEVWDKYRGDPYVNTFNPDCFLLKSKYKHGMQGTDWYNYYCWGYNFQPLGGRYWWYKTDTRDYLICDPRSGWKYYLANLCKKEVEQTKVDGIELWGYWPELPSPISCDLDGVWYNKVLELDLDNNGTVDDNNDRTIWRNRMLDMAEVIRDALPGSIIIYNPYIRGVNADAEEVYLPHNPTLNVLDGMVSEKLLFWGSCWIVQGTPTFDQWKTLVNNMISTDKIFLIKNYEMGRTPNPWERGYDFCLSTYLLGRRIKNNCYYSWGEQQTSPFFYSMYEIDIGEPRTNSYSTSGNLYYRDYTNGVVVVNPNSSAQTFNFSGTKYLLEIEKTYKNAIIETSKSGSVSVQGWGGAILSNSPFYEDFNCFFPMEENAGTTINDWTRNKKIAGLQGGVTWDYGCPGFSGEYGSNCLVLDGINGCLNFGDNFEIFPCSFELWFSPSFTIDYNNTSETVVLLGKEDQIIVSWEPQEKGKLVFKIKDGSTWHKAVSRRSIWKKNIWYHLSVTWGPKGMEIYINGEKEGTNSYTGGIGNTSNNLYIGGLSNFKYFKGKVDNFSVLTKQKCSVSFFNLDNLNLEITAYESGLLLKWDIPVENEGILKEFNIYRKEEGKDYEIFQEGINAREFKDWTAKRGKVYSYQLEIVDKTEIGVLSSSVSALSSEEKISSLSIYPNPSSSFTIKYNLNRASNITIKVYNIAGELIKILLEDIYQPSGEHTLEWSGTNKEGKKVSPGAYFISIQAEDENQVKKVIFCHK